MNGNISKRKKGQTLIETMVALSVLMVGMMGILGLLSRSFAISNLVSDSYTATYLAAEGIEVTKNLLDHNVMKLASTEWNAGFAINGEYEVDSTSQILVSSVGGCRILFDANTNLYGCSLGTPTKFRRKIVVESIDSNHLKINSIVTWSTSGGITGVPISSEINLEDHFFNPRSQ